MPCVGFVPPFSLFLFAFVRTSAHPLQRILPEQQGDQLLSVERRSIFSLRPVDLVWRHTRHECESEIMKRIVNKADVVAQKYWVLETADICLLLQVYSSNIERHYSKISKGEEMESVRYTKLHI